MAGKTLFILNPISGRTSWTKKLAGLEKVIADNPVYTLQETEYHGHATELARSNHLNYQTIVAIGGDGTVSEVAAGLENTQAIMGIIPLGSGNGLAHHLGIPDDWRQALSIIENAQPKEIDLVKVNEKSVINVGGLGFDGHVAALFNKTTKRGLFTYIKIILSELFKYQEFDYEIKAADFTNSSKAFIIAIANASEFGNRFKIVPDADHNDGMFNLVVIKKPPLWQLPYLFVKGYQGKLKQSKYYQTYLLEEAQISFSNTVAHCDGEVDHESLNSPLQISINKSALKIYY